MPGTAMSYDPPGSTVTVRLPDPPAMTADVAGRHRNVRQQVVKMCKVVNRDTFGPLGEANRVIYLTNNSRRFP